MGRGYLLRGTFLASWEETWLGIRGEREVYSSMNPLLYVPFAFCTMRIYYFLKINNFNFFLNFEYPRRLNVFPMSLWSCLLESNYIPHFHHLLSWCRHPLGILWPSFEDSMFLQLLGSVVVLPGWTDLKNEICAFLSSSSRRHWLLTIYICVSVCLSILSGLTGKRGIAVSFCLRSTACNLSMNWPWMMHRNSYSHTCLEVPPDGADQFCVFHVIWNAILLRAPDETS